jgi:prepilin-type N-terminal cleavage/methylation domain-containing protein
MKSPGAGCQWAAGWPGRPRTRVMRCSGRDGHGGFTLVELLLALSVIVILTGMAVPMTSAALDELNTAAAARYVAAVVLNGRMDSLKRARSIGLRFEASGADYTFGSFADGNGNGVRTADIRGGVDTPLGGTQRLSDNFRGVRFGLRPDVPDADGVRGGSTDGVRIGTARILTTSPDGTATSGTLYVQGRRAQYAVRILGATARTRVLKFESGAGTWTSR